MTTIRVPLRPAEKKKPKEREEACRAAFPPPDGGWMETDVLCDLCETPMYELHCKLVCPNCGYKRDCNDP